MPDAGDSEIVALAVSPADGTTVAALTLTAPDGTTSTPTVTAADSNATWTAEVTYTTAGVWLLKWVVTGTGRGVEYQKVAVAPTPVTGRSYATSTDLANWMHEAPPLNSDALLEGATRYLDNNVLRTSIYDVDDDDMPTDADVTTALTNATCALAKWWDDNGITGEDANSVYTTVSIGSASFTKTPGAGGGSADPRVSLEAQEVLAGAGLLGNAIWTY